MADVSLLIVDGRRTADKQKKTTTTTATRHNKRLPMNMLICVNVQKWSEKI